MQSSGISSRETPSASQSPAGPTLKRFALSGHSTRVDPRIDAVRGDLADVRLAERVFAPHYALAITVSANTATPILAAAKAGATALSEILPGEGFDVLEIATEYAWGMCLGDGAVGFVARSTLDWTDPAAPAPLLAGGPIEVAENLIGAPARAGGRSPAGFDAAGLIFYILTRTGHASPRFADLQAKLGSEVEDGLARGDLVFFQDHAAIMADTEHAIHVADTVVREPLAILAERFGPVIARRRL